MATTVICLVFWQLLWISGRIRKENLELKLDNHSTTIEDLFKGQKRYQIPRYQRGYVWNDANWQTLWQDIIQFPSKHFTGTIITYTDNEDISNEYHEIVEVVDGQQRLTTFQVIFSIIRDLFKSNEEFLVPTHTDVNRLILRLTNYIEVGIGEYRLITTRGSDGEAFKSVVSGELWKNRIQGHESTLAALKALLTNQSEQNPIITAYGYFGIEIVTFLREGISGKLLELVNYLSQNFRVVQVELDSDHDPEKIFQTINDTGRMLTDFDYLRNYLFLRTRKRLRGRPSDRLYDLYWDRFEEWDTEKLDLFLRTFLEAKLGPTCFKGESKVIKPFDCYRKHIKTVEGSNQDFIPLLQLSRYSEFYEELNNPTSEIKTDSDTRKLGNRMQFYDDLELPRLDSFLLFMKHALEQSDEELLKEHTLELLDEKGIDCILESYPELRRKSASELSDEELCTLCDILESYIVRRWLCDGSYEESYEEINVFFSQKIRSKSNVSEFAKHLLKTWPDPNQVEEVLRERADSVVPNLVFYILYRIELRKRENSTSFRGDTHTSLTLSSKSVIEQLVSSTDLLKMEAEASGSARSVQEIQSLTDETSIAAKGIGNIKSTTSDRGTSWNMEKILDRTSVLLDYFNEIWKPNF